jgi:hypothetical protein
MHYSIWKGLSLVGKEKNPLFKGKARRESKINRKNPFPADGTLGLGLIPSQTRIRKSALELQINHNKQYKKRNGFSCRRERKKRQKGGEIGKRRLRIVTPLHR